MFTWFRNDDARLRRLPLAVGLLSALPYGWDQSTFADRIQIIAMTGLDSAPGGIQTPTLRTTHPDCIPGALHCECTSNQTCLPSEGGIAVACEGGYCVPVTCPRGGEGCDCYGNNTCDPLNGVPMACVGGTCVRTADAAPGALNAPCGDELAGCTAHLGQALVCLGGTCQLADCPSGAVHCPCAGRDACYGELVCDDGTCVPPACVPGARGCPCRAGANACDEGGVCSDGVCTPPRWEVVVDNVRVRGCEFALDESNVTPEDLRWSDRVIGEYYHRSPRVGGAFVTASEASAHGAAALSFVLGETHNPALPAGVVLSDVRCFDDAGEVVGGNPLVLVAPGGIP